MVQKPTPLSTSKKHSTCQSQASGSKPHSKFQSQGTNAPPNEGAPPIPLVGRRGAIADLWTREIAD